MPDRRRQRDQARRSGPPGAAYPMNFGNGSCRTEGEATVKDGQVRRPPLGGKEENTGQPGGTIRIPLEETGQPDGSLLQPGPFEGKEQKARGDPMTHFWGKEQKQGEGGQSRPSP